MLQLRLRIEPSRRALIRLILQQNKSMSYCAAVKQSRGKIKLLNCATKVREQAKG